MKCPLRLTATMLLAPLFFLATGSASLADPPTVRSRPEGLAMNGGREGAHEADRSLGIVRSPSVARLWNEQLLSAIRIDIPKPPVHARNLFHLSVAMWDAWAAYSHKAVGYVVTEKQRGVHIKAARNEAISFAAYRLLQYRFPVGFTDADGKQ